MAIEKLVVPLLAISFSDYGLTLLVNEKGSFSHAHINRKLLSQYLKKYSYFDYLYYYTKDEQGFQKSLGMTSQQQVQD